MSLLSGLGLLISEPPLRGRIYILHHVVDRPPPRLHPYDRGYLSAYRTLGIACFAHTHAHLPFCLSRSSPSEAASLAASASRRRVAAELLSQLEQGPFVFAKLAFPPINQHVVLYCITFFFFCRHWAKLADTRGFLGEKVPDGNIAAVRSLCFGFFPNDSRC